MEEHTLLRSYNLRYIKNEVEQSYMLFPGDDLVESKKRKVDEVLKGLSKIAPQDDYLRLTLYHSMGLVNEFEKVNEHVAREHIATLFKFICNYSGYCTVEELDSIREIVFGKSYEYLSFKEKSDRLNEILLELQNRRKKDVIDFDGQQLNESDLKDHFLNTAYRSDGNKTHRYGTSAVLSSQFANSF